MNLLKNGFFDSQWTQLNTINNVVWFKCELCAKRLKVVCLDDHCVAHIEDSYFVDGVHTDNEKEKVERGIPENLRTEILSLYNA